MIRCAAAADAPRLSQIIQRSEQSEEHPSVRNLFKKQRRVIQKGRQDLDWWSPSDHIYVFDDNGIIKGMISWEQTEPVCEKKNSELCCYSDLCCYEKFSSCSVEILGIYVDPVYRGTGIGRQMMSSFLKNMQYQDIRCASMWILDVDAVSAEFCQKFGFEQTTDVREMPNGLRFVKYIHQYY